MSPEIRKRPLGGHPAWSDYPGEGLSERMWLPRDETEWMARAACKPETSEKFFPEVTSNARGTSIERAEEHKGKRICARCPVRRECLQYALTFADVRGSWNPSKEDWNTPNAVGIYGGLTPRERRSKAIRFLPLDVRLDILEDIFRTQTDAFMTPDEEVA